MTLDDRSAERIDRIAARIGQVIGGLGIGAVMCLLTGYSYHKWTGEPLTAWWLYAAIVGFWVALCLLFGDTAWDVGKKLLDWFYWWG